MATLLNTMPILSHPRLQHLKPILQASEVGADVVSKLDNLPARVWIVPPPPERAPAALQDFYGKHARSAAYHPAANAMILPEVALHPDGMTVGKRLYQGSSPEQLAVTVAHEGVHRIQRGSTQDWMRKVRVEEPRDAARAVVDAITGPSGERSLPAEILRELDEVALGDEVGAYTVHAKIARDLGVESRFVKADGSIMSEDEILDTIRAMGPYRVQATLKQISWAAQAIETARRGAKMIEAGKNGAHGASNLLRRGG